MTETANRIEQLLVEKMGSKEAAFDYLLIKYLSDESFNAYAFERMKLDVPTSLLETLEAQREA
jgi:hypothetical protein